MKRKYGEYLPEGTCVVLAGKECRISGAPLAETTECILYPAELLGPGKLLSGFALMEGDPDAALQGPYILGSGAGTFQKYVSAGEAVIARRGRKEKTVRGSFALLDHVPQKLRPLRRKKPGMASMSCLAARSWRRSCVLCGRRGGPGPRLCWNGRPCCWMIPTHSSRRSCC